MDFNWNYGADVDQDDGKVTPSGNASLSDYPKALGGAVAGLGATAAAGARAASENTSSPNAAAIWHFIQDAGEDLSDDAHKAMTPEAQEQLHAAVTSPEFWNHPISGAVLKSLDMTPTLAATIGPALLAAPVGPEASTAAVAATGGALGAAQSARDVYDQTDQWSDEDFQQHYPYYAQLRQQGMDETEARAKANKELMGFKPVLNAAVNAGAMLLGPAGRVAGVIPEGAGAGLLTRMGAGAGETALGNAAMAGTSEYTNQQTQVQLDERTQLDPSLIAAATVEGSAVGAVMGAAGGIATHGDETPAFRPKTFGRVQMVDGRSPDAAQEVALADKQPATQPAEPTPQSSVQAPTVEKPNAEIPPNSAVPTPGGDSSAAQSGLQRGVTPPPAVDLKVNDAGKTVPEARETLQAQQDQLVAGQRQAMLFPKGSGQRLPLPDGMKVMNTKDGVFHYNPKLVKPKQIYDAAKSGDLNKILALGDYSKNDVAARVAAGEPTVAVTERQTDGTEVKAAAGTPSTAADQISSLEASKTPGNTVQVENPQNVVADRVAQAKAAAASLRQKTEPRVLKAETPKPEKPQARVKPKKSQEAPAPKPEVSTLQPDPELHELPPQVMAGVGRDLEKYWRSAEAQEAAGNPIQGGIPAFIERKKAELITKARAGLAGEGQAKSVPTPRARAQEKNEGKHFTKAQIEERTANNQRASDVVWRFIPGEDENVRTPDGRAAVLDRVRGMLEAAQKDKVKIPGRIQDGTKKEMEHNAAATLLAEANAVARLKAVSTDDLNKFLSREHLLRSGENDAHRQVLQERRDEANEKMAPRKEGKGPDVPSKDLEKESEEIPDESSSPELGEKTPEEPGAKAALEGTERARVALKGDEGTGVKDRAGTFKVEKKRRQSRMHLIRDDGDAEHLGLNAEPNEDNYYTPNPEEDKAYETFLGRLKQDPPHKSTISKVLGSLRFEEYKGAFPSVITSHVAGRLRDLVGDVPVNIVSDEHLDEMSGGSGLGFYYAANKDDPGVIYVKKSLTKHVGRFQRTMIHESVHAALIRSVNRSPEFAKTIGMMAAETHAYLEKNLATKVDPKDYFGSQYAFTNEHEFVAEMMANPSLQRVMGQIEVSKELAERIGLGKQQPTLRAALIELVRKMLGLPKNSGHYRMLEAALHLGNDLFDAREKLNAVKTSQARDSRIHFMRAGDFTDAGNRAHVDDINRIFQPKFNDVVSREVGNAKAGAQRWVDTLTDPAKTYQSVIERTGDLGGVAQKALRYFTTFEQLVTHGKNAELLPEGRNISSTIERAGVYARKLKDDGIDLAGALVRAQKMNPGRFDEFSRLINEQTMHGADASAELGEGRNRHLALSKELTEKIAKGARPEDVAHEAAMNVWEAREAHPDLQARYKALVKANPEYATLQDRLFDFYDKTQREMAKDQMDTIVRRYGFTGSDDERKNMVGRLIQGRLTDEERENFAGKFEGDGENALKHIDAVDALKIKQGPYAPLMRRGEHAVLGEYKVIPTKGATKIDDNTYEFKDRDQAHEFATKNGLSAKNKIVYYDTATGERVKSKADAISTVGQPEQRFQVKVNRQHLEFHETAAEARASMEAHQKSGLFDKLGLEERRHIVGENSELTGRGVEGLLRSLAAQGKYQEMSELEKGVLRHTIREAGLRAMTDNRVQSRRLPRRNVQGASNDVARNLIDYNHSQANYRAKLRYRQELEEHLKAMWGHVAASRYTPENLARSQLANEIEQRARAEDPNQTTGAWTSFTRRLMTWSYIDRMMRASHLILHQTHLPMITAPYMAGRHGAMNSFGATLKAWRELSDFYNAGGRDAWAALAGSPLQKFSDYAELAKSRLSNARERDMIDQLSEDGIIHPSMGQEVDKYVPSKELSGLVGGVDRGLNKLDTIFRQLTNATEAINRMAGATAAYRLEYARLTREGKPSDSAHAAAVEYARRTLADTQGRFSATNNAPIFKNKYFRPFLQFKQFPQMMYHLLGKLAVQALKGETKQAKIEAVASLASILGMHMMMAGVLQGLPLEPFKLMGLVSKGIGLTDGDWSDVEAAVTRSINANFGESVGHLLTRGLGAEMGVDVHHRLGLNSFITYGMPEQLDSKNVSEFVLNAVGGAPYGMAKDAIGGVHKMLDGDFEGGALQAMPLQTLRDIHSAINPAANKYGYQATAADRVKSVLGFTPEAKAVAAQKKEAVYNAIQDYDQKRSGFIKSWTAAQPAARERVWDKIQAWNNSLPTQSRVTKGDLYKALSRQARGNTSRNSVDNLKVNRQTRPIAERAGDVYN